MSKGLKTLDQVIGHVKIISWFKSAISRDKVPQVIMLSGSPGIGKTTIAKIVACEIAYMINPSLMEKGKTEVIENSRSTDCVKLYNMSNLKSQEAVAEVKNDLSLGFSSTGRKVIVMDEAHGMNDEAQDSLLVAFESLPTGVFIIICSTELESFRDAFLSRCVLRRLNNLSQMEMKQFLKNKIRENKLKFTLSENMVLALIMTYTGREPRRAINLLDSFEEGSTVDIDDLESFINVYEGKQTMALITHLYSGNILNGLEFISDLTIDKTFSSTLIEIVRVSQGGRSDIIDRDTSLYLQELITREGSKNLIGFAVDVTTSRNINRSILSGYFIKWSKAYEDINSIPVKSNIDSIQMQDLMSMNELIENKDSYSNDNSGMVFQSLESLLEESEVAE